MTFPTLLILGGSLGAGGLNDAVTQAIDQLKDQLVGWKIIHQTGQRDLKRVQQRYSDLGITVEAVPFIDDMAGHLRDAEIVVCRAGATTLAEIACLGKTTIVIPWDKSADGHQMLNAGWYSDQNAAVLANETDESNTLEGSVSVQQALSTLIATPELRKKLSDRMRATAKPQAASAVAEIVHSISE